MSVTIRSNIDTMMTVDISLNPNSVCPGLGFAKRRVTEEISTDTVATQGLSTLQNMPIELILMVADYLPLVDAACIALCSHQLILSLGYAIPRVSKHQQMRLDLLSRISRDLKQYYACLDCARLHPCHNIALPSPTSKPPGCSMYSPRGQNPISHTIYPYYANFEFQSTHLQLAMKRFYHGEGFGIAAEDLRYTEVSNWPLADNNGHFQSTLYGNFMTALKSVEAGICPAPPKPSLCLRIQEMMMIRKEKVRQILPFARGRMGPLMICQHIELSVDTYGNGTRYEHMRKNSDREIGAKFLIDQFCSDLDPHPVHFQRCFRCHTSWKLELRASQGNNVFLISTRWLSLGPGLTLEDEGWKAQRFDLPFEELEGFARVDARTLFEKESIQARLSEKDLFRRSALFLKKRNYEKLMNHWKGEKGENEKWFLFGEEFKKEDVDISRDECKEKDVDISMEKYKEKEPRYCVVG